MAEKRKRMWGFHIHGCLLARNTKKDTRSKLIELYGDTAGSAIPIEPITVSWHQPAKSKGKGKRRDAEDEDYGGGTRERENDFHAARRKPKQRNKRHG